MPTGTVKWFDEERGFGYIQPDGGGPDVFVHRTVTRIEGDALSEAQAVEYDEEATPKGPRALAVRTRPTCA